MKKHKTENSKKNTDYDSSYENVRKDIKNLEASAKFYNIHSKKPVISKAVRGIGYTTTESDGESTSTVYHCVNPSPTIIQSFAASNILEYLDMRGMYDENCGDLLNAIAKNPESPLRVLKLGWKDDSSRIVNILSKLNHLVYLSLSGIRDLWDPSYYSRIYHLHKMYKGDEANLDDIKKSLANCIPVYVLLYNEKNVTWELAIYNEINEEPKIIKVKTLKALNNLLLGKNFESVREGVRYDYDIKRCISDSTDSYFSTDTYFMNDFAEYFNTNSSLRILDIGELPTLDKFQTFFYSFAKTNRTLCELNYTIKHIKYKTQEAKLFLVHVERYLKRNRDLATIDILIKQIITADWIESKGIDLDLSKYVIDAFGCEALIHALITNDKYHLEKLKLKGVFYYLGESEQHDSETAEKYCECIVYLITSKTELRVLDIRNNALGLSPQGALKIAEALAENKTLQTVDMCGNGFDEKTASQLIEIISKNTGIIDFKFDTSENKTNIKEFTKNNKALHKSLVKSMKKGSEEDIQAILDKGANPRIRNKEGRFIKKLGPSVVRKSQSKKSSSVTSLLENYENTLLTPATIERYPCYLLYATGVSKEALKQQSIYLYRNGTQEKVYVLVIHSEDQQERFCLSDALEKDKKMKLLDDIKWPKKANQLVSLKQEVVDFITNYCKNNPQDTQERNSQSQGSDFSQEKSSEIEPEPSDYSSSDSSKVSDQRVVTLEAKVSEKTIELPNPTSFFTPQDSDEVKQASHPQQKENTKHRHKSRRHHPHTTPKSKSFNRRKKDEPESISEKSKHSPSSKR